MKQLAYCNGTISYYNDNDGQSTKVTKTSWLEAQNSQLNHNITYILKVEWRFSWKLYRDLKAQI